MTADTAAVRIYAQYLDQGSPTLPLLTFAPSDWMPTTPTQQTLRRMTVPTAPGITISLASWASILVLLVKSRDPSAYVELAYTYTDAALVAHPNVTRIPTSAVLAVPGPITIANNVALTAFGNSAVIDLAIIGT